MFSLWRTAAPRTLGRPVAICSVVTAAVIGLCGSPAWAQETVYVGGSGQQSVEVNLDVLDNLPRDGYGRQLLHPGERPVYLRRPLRERGSNIARVPASSIQAPNAVAARPVQPATRRIPAATAAPIQAPAVAQLPLKPLAPLRRAAPVPLLPLPGAPQPQPATTPNVQERLTELAALRNEDLITDSDYTAKRAEILRPKASAPLAPPASSAAPVSASPGQSATRQDQKRLDALTALWDQDLITETDYNAKRAAILGVPVDTVEVPDTAPSVPPPSTPAPAIPETSIPVPVKVAPVRVATVPEPSVAAAPIKPPVQVRALKKAAPAKTEIKIAALPKRPPPIDGTRQLRLDFESAASNLTPSQAAQLKDLASRLKDNNTRLQVRAYAGASGEDKGSARRSSLKRALAVRSRLIEGGIRSTRIDVRALGVAGDEGPADRVDIYTVTR